MPDERVPRMYGITCPNCGHAIRLGKEPLPPDAPVSKLRDAIAARYGQINSDECLECNAGIQFSLDDVRFVDDVEPPPEHEVIPVLGPPE
jgi:hypothetical protein